MFRVTDRSRARYQKILQVLQPSPVNHYGTTTRNRVTKDVWINNQGTLYHYLINSKDSILHLNQNLSSRTYVVEEMEDITCYLQQKKLYLDSEGNETSSPTPLPIQQVCVLKMNKGSYNYFTQNFLGDDVQINVYQLPGHELSSTLSFQNATELLNGHCDSINMLFKDQKPYLKTNNLKAQVFVNPESTL